MLPYNVHKNNLGFNLIEISAIALVVGILAASSIPSLWGMFQQFRTDESFNQLRGAIQEAQSQAIKRSQPCTIVIDRGNKEIRVNDPTVDSGCLLKTREIPDNVDLNLNGTSTITFNIRGGTAVASAKTIVMYDAGESRKKCLVISGGIGLMRTGNYEGTNPSASVDPNQCKSPQ